MPIVLILFDINYTVWKWVLFGFFAFFFLVSLIMTTQYGLMNYEYPIETNICLWMGILLPLLFLLPLRQLGRIDDTGKIILLFFICNFISIGFGPISIRLIKLYLGGISLVIITILYIFLVYIPIGILFPIGIIIQYTFIILLLISIISITLFVSGIYLYNPLKQYIKLWRIPSYSPPNHSIQEYSFQDYRFDPAIVSPIAETTKVEDDSPVPPYNTPTNLQYTTYQKPQ
jgi:hypothetical protein